MSNVVRVFALGGLDENGKNMTIVEINNDIFVLDAGIKYPESSMPGIDIIIPDISYLKENKSRVKAYLISHGQDDQMGALGYVIKEVPAPIYTSRISALFIQDTARRYHIEANFNFHHVSSGETVLIAGHKIRFFATTHSTMDSLGFSLDTPDGQIVYTGDFMFDFGANPLFRTDLKTLSDIAESPVLCLLAESMGATKTGHASPSHRLTPLIESYFQEEKGGRLIISAYSQSFFGILEVIDLALKYKKKILFYSREMRSIIKQLTDMKIISIPSNYLLDYSDLTRPGNDNIVILVTGVGEKVFNVLERIATGDQEKNLTIVPTDTFIVATPPITGLEKISAQTIDELFKTGANVFPINRRKLISMHAHEEDIKMMLSMVRPKYYMPIKGEYHHLVANAQVAVGMNSGYNHLNTFVFDNGMVARFENGKKVDGIDPMVANGSIMVDGLVVGDVGGYVISDRQKLADNGVVILGISVSRTLKEIVGGPDVQIRGLIFLKNQDDFVKEIISIFEGTVKEALNMKNFDNEETRQRVRERIALFIRRSTGKEPIILPAVIEI